MRKIRLIGLIGLIGSTALGQGTAVRSNNGTATNLSVVSASLGAPALTFTDTLGFGDVTRMGLFNGSTSLGVRFPGSVSDVYQFGNGGFLSTLMVHVQNGVLSMPTTSRTIIGNGAGATELNGTFDTEDTLIGFNAGNSLFGTFNTFSTVIGSAALGACTNAFGAVIIGQKSAVTATNCGSSTCIGSKTAASLPWLQNDTFIGYAAGQFTVTTTPGIGQRTFIGYDAGDGWNGEQNTVIGAFSADLTAGLGTNGLGTGSQNVIIGDHAGRSISNATQSVIIGSQAGNGMINGGSDAWIGYQAGSSDADSLNCVGIGIQAGLHNTRNNNTHIGAFAGNNSSAFSQINIGYKAGANNNQNYTAIFGGDDAFGFVTNVYFGGDSFSAVSSNYPVTLQGTGGLGTDKTGANVFLNGGQGTGAAPGGNVSLGVSLPGSTGTNANPTTAELTVNGKSGVVTILSQLVLNQTTNTPVNTNNAVTWFVVTNKGVQFFVPGFK